MYILAHIFLYILVCLYKRQHLFLKIKCNSVLYFFFIFYSLTWNYILPHKPTAPNETYCIKPKGENRSGEGETGNSFDLYSLWDLITEVLTIITHLVSKALLYKDWIAASAIGNLMATDCRESRWRLLLLPVNATHLFLKRYLVHNPLHLDFWQTH